LLCCSSPDAVDPRCMVSVLVLLALRVDRTGE
jgi:hypothetical protein